MKAAFLDFSTVDLLGDLDLRRLRAGLPDLVVHDATPDDEVDARLEGLGIVLMNSVRLTRERLAAHPSIRLVALTATGTNNVDLEAARELGIAVCNITDYCTRSVAQHVFATLLALTHHLRDYDRALKAGAWEQPDARRIPNYPIRELAGLNLGLVGHGTLGRSVARVAEAFEMHVLIAARPGEAPAPGRWPLAELLPLVDVLSLHCPITAATRNLIGAAELALMKPDAVLINTARGGLVDAAALAAAPPSRPSRSAAIDVLAEEPPVSGNPLLAPDLGSVIITPHTAWAAREARQRAIDELAANVETFLAGGRRNRVV